jgi:hypothetical protein
MIRAFLAAGYIEQWPYHRTSSGTPHGGVLSPLLCHIFLHQLDEHMMRNLRANETQRKRESNARRNPAYRTIERKLARLRRQLKETQGSPREALITELMGMERPQRLTPCYAKDKKHPSKGGYARYADDVVIMVQGKTGEAQARKDEVGKKLHGMGLALSEEKTKLTHWRDKVHCLGDQLHVSQRGKEPVLDPSSVSHARKCKRSRKPYEW